MKAAILPILLCLTFSLQAQTKVDQTLIVRAKYLMQDSKSSRAYLDLVALHGNLEKGPLQEKLTALGILGASLHSLKDEYTFFVAYMQKNYPASALFDTISTKNISQS